MIREALYDFAGFAEEARREALYGFSWMSRREEARRIEIVEEFFAASRMGGERSVAREMLGFFDERAAAAVHVIHRPNKELDGGAATRRASDWYALHREELTARKQHRKEERQRHAPPCAGCGERITTPPKRGHAVRKFCSLACQKRHIRERVAQQRAEAFVAQPPCGQCGQPITTPPKRGSRVRKWCSAKCLKLAHYYRAKEASA